MLDFNPSNWICVLPASPRRPHLDCVFMFVVCCREAANAIRFAELFSFMPEVVVPKMYTEWTTSRVLVMEWIEGERLRSASKQAPAVAATGGAAAPAAVTPVASSGVSSSAVSSKAAVRRQLVQQHHSSPEQVAEDLRLVEIGVRCSLEQMLEEG